MNRSHYKKLRAELHNLTAGGSYMQCTMQEEGANNMQRLAVQIICQQLEKTWQYFTRTFKMQVMKGKCTVEYSSLRISGPLVSSICGVECISERVP